MTKLNETNTELYHHGILGQKWGIRRFQNPDGTLTEAGKKRVSTMMDKSTGIREKMLSKLYSESDKNKGSKHGSKLFQTQKNMLKSASESFRSKENSLVDTLQKTDDMGLKYSTKDMTEDERKLYSLNYYNDKKNASKIELNRINDAGKNEIYSQQEQMIKNLLGSDFYNDYMTKHVEDLTKTNAYYSKKVDDMLEEYSNNNIDLITVPSFRYVNTVNGNMSWNGEKYIRKQ